MNERNYRKQLYKKEHEPQSIKTTKKVIKWVLITIGVSFCLLCMLNPFYLAFGLLGLVVSGLCDNH